MEIATTAYVPMPTLTRSKVRDEWIDSNDHMNSAMYFVAFRDSSGPLLRAAGFTPEFVATSGYSLVQREAHIRYVRELRRGEPILMRSWIAGLDDRCVHLVSEMRHGEADWLSATVEFLYTCFDRRARRTVDWPREMKAALETLRQAGAATMPAEAVGRQVAVRSGKNPAAARAARAGSPGSNTIA